MQRADTPKRIGLTSNHYCLYKPIVLCIVKWDPKDARELVFLV